MADARAARTVLEILAASNPRASVTRQGLQAALAAPGTNTAAEVSAARLAVEALGEAQAWVSFTRNGLQAALQTPGARADLTVTSPALELEVLAHAEETASVTRQGIQAALSMPGANAAATVRAPSLVMEVLARAFTPVTPFTPPDGWQFFLQNWASEVQVESTYSTDITDSADEVCEERTGLIEKPYRRVPVSWIAKGNEQAAVMISELRRLTKETSAIPLYPDLVIPSTESAVAQNTILGDFSQGRYATGVPVVVATVPASFDPYGGDMVEVFEVRTIQARLSDRLVFTSVLENTHPANRTLVMPLLQTHPQVEIEYRLLTNNTVEVTAQFEEVYGPSAIAPLASGVTTTNQYDGKPILALGADWSSGIEHTIKREGTKSALGRGQVVYQRGDRGRLIKELDFAEERTNAWDLLRFFDSRKGRLLPFWVIDLDNVYTVPLISTTKVTVSQLGSFEDFQEEMEFFGLLFSDGTAAVREAGAIQEVGGAWEIFPDADLPSGYTAADVIGFGRARLCRMDKDSLRENWDTTNVCRLTIPCIELLDEREVT